MGRVPRVAAWVSPELPPAVLLPFTGVLIWVGEDWVLSWAAVPKSGRGCDPDSLRTCGL